MGDSTLSNGDYLTLQNHRTNRKPEDGFMASDGDAKIYRSADGSEAGRLVIDRVIWVTLENGSLTAVIPGYDANESVGTILMAAGYEDGRMTGCQVIGSVTDVTETELTVSGDTIEVFALDPDTYAPLAIRLKT